MNHEHKYYLSETRAAFEQFKDADLPVQFDKRDLYERIEYSILSCSCGDVIKKAVRVEVTG